MYEDDLYVVVGDCPSGVDKFVREVCADHTIVVDIFEAEWNTYGKGAGHKRNGVMVSQQPELCYAFRDEGPSPGTDDCVRQAMAAGVSTYIVRKSPTPADMPITSINPKKMASNLASSAKESLGAQ